MKKYLLTLMMAVGLTVASLAETYPMYGFASQIGEGSLMPFSDVKSLTMPDDPDLPYEFMGDKWYYADGDVEELTVFVSKRTDDEQLVFDGRQLLGPEVLLMVYTVGNISYYYASEPVNAADLGNVGVISSDQDYGSGESAASGNYEAMYDRWERQASHAYDSLTHASVSSTTYVRNKQLLRDAQRQMRSVRRKAAAAGIQIPKSEWEDATVKLR